MSPEFDDMFVRQWWSSRPDGLPGEPCPNIGGPITRTKLRLEQIYQPGYSLNGSEEGKDTTLELDSRASGSNEFGSQQIRRWKADGNGSEEGEDMPLEIDSSGRDARSPAREAIGSQQIRRWKADGNGSEESEDTTLELDSLGKYQ